MMMMKYMKYDSLLSVVCVCLCMRVHVHLCAFVRDDDDLVFCVNIS